MLTAAVGLAGSATSVALWRTGQRFSVRDRLRPSSTRLVRPPALREWLARALDDALLSTTPEHALQIWLLAVLAAAVFGLGIGVAVAVGTSGAVFVAGPVGLRSMRHRRARAVAAAIPTLLDHVSAELRAGGTVATAIARLAAGDTLLAPGLATVEARLRLGASFADAMRAWSTSCAAPGSASAAGALALSNSVGGRSADALDGLGASLRERLGLVSETRALSAQARYSALVIGLGPIVYLAGSAALDPRSLHALAATPTGRACLLAGSTLELFGAWWMRRIVRSVESDW
jgi:tight adherence protein B